MPSTVTEIGGSVFYGCKDLRSISLDQYNQNFTSYKGALFNKDKTVLLVYPAGGTGSYTVPDGCKVIGESACLFEINRNCYSGRCDRNFGQCILPVFRISPNITSYISEKYRQECFWLFWFEIYKYSGRCNQHW